MSEDRRHFTFGVPDWRKPEDRSRDTLYRVISSADSELGRYYHVEMQTRDALYVPRWTDIPDDQQRLGKLLEAAYDAGYSRGVDAEEDARGEKHDEMKARG